MRKISVLLVDDHTVVRQGLRALMAAEEDMEVIGEAADFLEKTKLAETRPDAKIVCTIPGGYHLLLDHIEVHRYLQSQEWSRVFSFEEGRP